MRFLLFHLMFLGDDIFLINTESICGVLNLLY